MLIAGGGTGAGAARARSTQDRVAMMGASVAIPRVTGPVTGGDPDVPANAMPEPLLKQYHYSEREFFIQGTATAYRPVGTWGENGRWAVAPASTAPYKTRIIVRAPIDPAKFNGTVVV
jgi:hypothetical protein